MDSLVEQIIRGLHEIGRGQQSRCILWMVVGDSGLWNEN